jgi:hypothetical protein
MVVLDCDLIGQRSETAAVVVDCDLIGCWLSVGEPIGLFGDVGAGWDGLAGL